MEIDYDSEGQETCSSFIYFYQQSSPRMLSEDYLRQKYSISSTGLSHKTYLFLVKLSRIGSSVISFSFEAVFSIVANIHQLLCLSDIEIALWEIYLRRFAWQISDSRLRESLLFSAYAAKCLLNDNTEEILLHLEDEPEWSLDRYIRWIEKFQNFINVDLYEINSNYSDLSYTEIKIEVSEDEVDYNSIVDEIIESTAETTKKRRFEKL
ncbi:unnamed protein product [Blepharisma stoltei]|uniref:Uncharacterized protein n=1 Tax=Blepharisma stoltei TaxID=1481888 RepID=A0AAU9KFJ1_9CILI|nr:unnamed protein product [Blepharisma stoltei]